VGTGRGMEIYQFKVTLIGVTPPVWRRVHVSGEFSLAQLHRALQVVMGWENVLDQLEGFTVDWGRERGRDPGLYYLRVFGEPGGRQAWGWRFGGHHVSLNYLVVNGAVQAVTPCFLGADPATARLLGDQELRPLGTAEDLARRLVRSLPPALAAEAVLLDRAPSDIVGGNRPRVTDGDEMILLTDLWRGHFTEPRLADRVTAMTERAEDASGTGVVSDRSFEVL